MTTAYSSYSALSSKLRAIVKCDECGKTAGIDILPYTTVQQNRVKLEDCLLPVSYTHLTLPTILLV